MDFPVIPMLKLILLDRDGVINVDCPDSVKSIEELALIPRAARAIGRLNAAGVKVAVITNQAVVGRGTITEAELNAIHQELYRLLSAEGATIDQLYACTSTDEANDPRRKPAPGMIMEAFADFNALPEECIFIGDALRDLEAAAAAGCHRALALTGKGEETFLKGFPEHVKPVWVYPDLASAVDVILDE